MEKYKKFIYITLSIGLFIAIIYLFMKYIFGIFVPFLIAFGIVSVSRPLIDKICTKTRVPKSVVSIFVIVFLLVGVSYLVVELFGVVTDELGDVLQNLSSKVDTENNFLITAGEMARNIETKFPFLSVFDANGDNKSVVLSFIQSALEKLSSELTTVITKVVMSMPQILIGVIVSVLSLFYFAKDYDKITGFFISFLPKRVKEKLPDVKNNVFGVITSYIRAYVILLFITFAELIAGFLILGIKNAFVLALIISFVDMLPIIGVGSVLMPWSVISLINGDKKLALGLLVLYLIMYVLRQIEEPRIVGKQMNLHPLLAIFALYAGFVIAGIGGMIISPFVAFAIKTVYKNFKNEKDIEKSRNM